MPVPTFSNLQKATTSREQQPAENNNLHWTHYISVKGRDTITLVHTRFIRLDPQIWILIGQIRSRVWNHIYIKICLFHHVSIVTAHLLRHSAQHVEEASSVMALSQSDVKLEVWHKDIFRTKVLECLYIIPHKKLWRWSAVGASGRKQEVFYCNTTSTLSICSFLQCFIFTWML